MGRQSNLVHPRLVRVTLAVVGALGVGLVGSAGCQANGRGAATAQAAEPAPPPPPDLDFDAGRARADLLRLDEASRGGRAARKARKLLKRSLVESGFEVIEVETPLPIPNAEGESATAASATHLFARVPAADGRDAILLVAPFGASPAEIDRDGRASGSASGAAVLLELARLHQRAYADGQLAPGMTWWIALVDGDDRAMPAAAADAPRRFAGSEAFAAWIAARPDAERIRLVVFIDHVAQPQLEVARDLRSNATYRDVFFSQGVARGHAAFDPERPLSAPAAGHRAFAALGIAPTVAIIGEPLAPMPVQRGGADGADAVDPESLLAVGDTVSISLSRIGDRLARIDAFRLDPLRGGPGELSLPGADDTEGAGDGEGEAAGSTAPATGAGAQVVAPEPPGAPARVVPGRAPPGEGSR